MKTWFVLSLLAGGALSVAATAEPVKMTDTQLDQMVAGKITTSNPGGQPGGCSNNPNCVSVNPTGKPPPGQNK